MRSRNNVENVFPVNFNGFVLLATVFNFFQTTSLICMLMRGRMDLRTIRVLYSCQKVIKKFSITMAVEAVASLLGNFRQMAEQLI